MFNGKRGGEKWDFVERFLGKLVFGKGYIEIEDVKMDFFIIGRGFIFFVRFLCIFWGLYILGWRFLD